VKVLLNIRCIEPGQVKDMVVRGQYGNNFVLERKIAAFREEKDINPASVTETYAAFKLFIDNARWQGVPFYLRCGKRLPRSVVSIDIQFKNPGSKLFSSFKFSPEAHANTLRIRIQPREGINFRFFAKVPGLSLELVPVNMDFSYQYAFQKEMIDSYEKILLDSMLGDQTLFATSRGFGATWEFITKILKGWQGLPAPSFPNYKAGSWGPEEADELLKRDGKHWLLH
jgi:glucose-6-phosphate 1-dehydrogenase